MASANRELLKHIWTHEVTLKFIDLYKKHVHLWDCEHPEYGKMVPRINSWHQLSNDLNLSDGDLKLKMTKLRQTFSQSWKNNKMLPYAADADHKWIYYAPMEFLEKSYQINDARRCNAIAVRSEVNMDRNHPSNARFGAIERRANERRVNERRINERRITIDDMETSSDTESEKISMPSNRSIKKLFSVVDDTVIKHKKHFGIAEITNATYAVESRSVEVQLWKSERA